MNSTLFTLAVILPSIRLKIAFRSIPSGTYGWKGAGTLSFPSACSSINWQPQTCIKGNHSKGANMQYSHCYFKSYDIKIMIEWLKTSMCINFLPPPLSHKFSIETREKVINIRAVSTYKTTDLYIKSTTLVRHSLLSVNTSARLLKGACPLSCPWVFFLDPFLHLLHFHVVVNWFLHLSIADRGVASTYSPVGLGLQIFYLTTLLLLINYAFWVS